jgi:TetR/AcrR family transcriptional regulator, tetracycline repressor protein
VPADRRAPLPPLWDDAPRVRPSLTRADLARAAVALLDDVGFDGLTMRALADRLGVKAASLYNHIRDKSDVLALAADAIVADVPTPAASLAWRQRLAAIAHAYRDVLLAHRDGARVLAVTPPIGPNRLRLMDEVLGILRHAGLSDEAVADAGWVFNTYVTGFVLDETMPQSTSREDTAHQVATWFSSLPPERFPNIVAVADPLLDGDTTRRFTFGLNAFLDGLEARMLPPPPFV